MYKIHVINGPNLNLLSERNSEIYGAITLEDICKKITNACDETGMKVTFFQSNHEGTIIDEIHRVRNIVDGIIINAGAYTHYSFALRDAIEILKIPVIEVHLSDIDSREEFRKKSVIAGVCFKQIKGLGAGSYLEAVKVLSDIFKQVGGI